jgi:hypothetical protein
MASAYVALPMSRANLRREPGWDECGFARAAVFEDFEEIVSRLWVEGLRGSRPPVVEDQQVGGG